MRPSFQSTRPLRGATGQSSFAPSCVLFQSTRPLRGATKFWFNCNPEGPISIHAPLAGRDQYLRKILCIIHISIHAPLAGRDQQSASPPLICSLFQSTRPLRGATPASRKNVLQSTFQSTRPLRGATCGLSKNIIGQYISIHAPLAGRHVIQYRPHHFGVISIHAPLAGRDVAYLAVSVPIFAFQSTRPLRGATYRADRGGGGCAHFNPRAPCGARRQPASWRPSGGMISIHAPLAGRDYTGGKSAVIRVISIHAPLAGRDPFG